MSGKHPIHVHPVRPFYRFTATALGASMWFFVGDYSIIQNGKIIIRKFILADGIYLADVPS
jgi:hypothetical protein